MKLTFEGRESNRLALWFSGSLEVFIFALITCDIYEPPEPEFGFQLSRRIEKLSDSGFDNIDSLDIFLFPSIPIDDAGPCEYLIRTWLGFRS